MKIHSNPHFSFRTQKNLATHSPTLLLQIERQNAQELERLREKQRLREEKKSEAASSAGKTQPCAHVHRVSGHVRPVKRGVPAHSHRFRGVTGEAIPTPGGHVHRIKGFTVLGRPSEEETELLAGVSEIAD